MKSFLWRHKSLVAIWLVVFGVGGYAGYALFFKSNGSENPYVLSNSSSKSSDSQEAAEAEAPKLTQVAVGESVSDGDFEFTVSGVRCDETTIGTNQYAHDQASGVFCRLQLAGKNTGSEAKAIPASRVKLIDSQGKSYDFDSAATLYAQADVNTPLWYENISAGSSASGDIVFDLPAGATPVKAIVFGGADTPGIEVQLN